MNADISKHIELIKLTDRNHGDEVGVLALQSDKPPKAVVVALARVAVAWCEVVPWIPNLLKHFNMEYLSFV